MIIRSFAADFTRDRLASPFGFKGGYLTQLWNSAVALSSSSGNLSVGLGTQSVLWSDPEVFASHGEMAGNAEMFLTTIRAAECAKGTDWSGPIEMLDAVLAPAHDRAKSLTRHENLRLTFTLNALVALDNAAWVLHAKERGHTHFDAMIPAEYKSVLHHRQRMLAAVPVVAYGLSLSSIEELLRQGCCVLKIKIGADPNKDGDLDKMLEWDCGRMSEVHALAQRFQSPHTESDRILYYLDANGRYDTRERLSRVLKHLDHIGALEHVVLLEEPFPEERKIDVRGLPVRIAADESAHSVKDVQERIALGYGAIALKPIAKTLSMSLQMARAAQAAGIPCFCADLTVNPILVEWNKNFAARLGCLPGMKIGLIESNGPQNYAEWKEMIGRHPYSGRPWVEAANGLFNLDDEFYEVSGGIFAEPLGYKDLLARV